MVEFFLCLGFCGVMSVRNGRKTMRFRNLCVLLSRCVLFFVLVFQVELECIRNVVAFDFNGALRTNIGMLMSSISLSACPES